ncbi:LPS-assembly protein LptD [Halanaerobium salsuginis]|uniref:LPS-assembly protein n=1 Tax=Halanaerobium salsuginis TaxID=29563 RepID=A0A1I4FLI6_9FIRM|nr:LPS-assembly protein LptD [Halanaerobium salsuginis]SFL18792.1 LPS-assembly protein [Halanaerobium salsuginis]
MEKKAVSLNYKWINFLLLIFLLIVQPLQAEEVTTDNYILEAEQIIFKQEQNLVFFQGDPSFKTTNITVFADKMKVDTANKIVTAEANVIISSDKNDLYGEKLIYNYETEQGELYGVKGTVGELHLTGEKLNILSVSPLTGEIESATFTPCSRKSPHYYYWSKQVKINADNTLDIYHIVPHIKKIPIFYLPYYSVTYDPSDEEHPFKDSSPIPKIGYNNDRGVTVDFNYPYRLTDSNYGNLHYITEGTDEERYETRTFTNYQRLTETLTLKNRYYYLYNYDIDDEELDDEDEEYYTSLVYRKNRLRLEAGFGRDLMEEEKKSRQFIAGGYSLKNGLAMSFRQEFHEQQKMKESYSLSFNKYPIRWNLRYRDGYDYNYYSYLTVSLPAWYGLRTTLASGRVENYGVELNKNRLNLNYRYHLPLPAGFSYHLNYNYRLDDYMSGYNSNYYYTQINTGLRYRKKLNEKLTLNSALFYQRNHAWGISPLADDREDEDHYWKPALSLNIKRPLPNSSISLETDAKYDIDLEDWDEINLRVRQNEDCYSLYIGYDLVDNAFSFGIEI